MAARSLKSAGISLVLSVIVALPAAATVVEVPLPDLAGTYSCNGPAGPGPCSGSLEVHLPAIPSVIHSVSLRVHGTTTFASYTCDGEYGPTAPTPFNTRFDVEIWDPGHTETLWIASRVNPVDGTIDFTQPFKPGFLNGGSWDFLLDGTASLFFGIQAVPYIPECYLVGLGDSTTLDDVTLLVDGDFPTPVKGFSWGGLKVIYR